MSNDETNKLEKERHPFTLKQSLEWASRNCTSEAVQRIGSRAVVARLVEEVNKLQALLAEIDNDLENGYYISYQASEHLDDYWKNIYKS